MRLNGKVAIITGAGGGQGKATAQLFAKEGAKVVIAEWNEELGKKVEEELRQDGYDKVFIKTDVSQEDAVIKLVNDTISLYGKIDILFNNAGIGYGAGYKMGSILETPLKDWNGSLSINLNGVYLMSKYVLPFMIEQKSGSIINNSSINGLVGHIGTPDAYTAAKGGIVSLTRVMAADYGKYNIRVNCICPGPIDTPMNAYALQNPKMVRYIEKNTLLGRVGKPEEIANVVLFLASDEASYVTGVIMPVDGGWTAV